MVLRVLMNSMYSEDSKWLVQGLLDSPQYYISLGRFLVVSLQFKILQRLFFNLDRPLLI